MVIIGKDLVKLNKVGEYFYNDYQISLFDDTEQSGKFGFSVVQIVGDNQHAIDFCEGFTTVEKARDAMLAALMKDYIDREFIG